MTNYDEKAWQDKFEPLVEREQAMDAQFKAEAEFRAAQSINIKCMDCDWIGTDNELVPKYVHTMRNPTGGDTVPVCPRCNSENIDEIKEPDPVSQEAIDASRAQDTEEGIDGEGT